MNVQDQIEAVKFWQDGGKFPPFKCGIDREHGKLVPEANGNKVVLKCPECKFAQHLIPKVVFSNYQANFKKEAVEEE